MTIRPYVSWIGCLLVSSSLVACRVANKDGECTEGHHEGAYVSTDSVSGTVSWDIFSEHFSAAATSPSAGVRCDFRAYLREPIATGGGGGSSDPRASLWIEGTCESPSKTGTVPNIFGITVSGAADLWRSATPPMGISVVASAGYGSKLISDREPYVQCSILLPDGYVTVTLENSIGGSMPDPDVLTPDFERVFRLDIALPPTRGLSAAECTESTVAMNGSLKLIFTRRMLRFQPGQSSCGKTPL